MHAIAFLNIFGQVSKSTLKHILVDRHAKHHRPVSWNDKGCKLSSSIFEEWKKEKNIFSFVEYISFAPDVVFYCWIAGGWVQKV